MARGSNDRKADLGVLVTVVVVTCRTVWAVSDNATTRQCRSPGFRR
ncbi:MAG TPA: hypothetical protein VN327_08290 [Pseudonocardiaceae bacterium]|nr:hypothetical protein [Pseudonocardiaceae bacterium]